MLHRHLLLLTPRLSFPLPRYIPLFRPLCPVFSPVLAWRLRERSHGGVRAKADKPQLLHRYLLEVAIFFTIV